MQQSRRAARRGRARVWSATFSLGFAACAGRGEGEPVAATTQSDLTTEPFVTAAPDDTPDDGAACDALLTNLQGQMLAQVADLAAQVRVSPNATGDVALARIAAVAAAPQPPAAGGFSGTPLHIPGVEEADVVQAEGDRLYVTNGSTLYVVDAADAEATTLIGSLRIEGEQAEVLVRDGRALVLSRVYGPPAGIEELGFPNYYFPTFTKLTLVDTLGAAPEVVREIYVEGELNDARRQGSLVRAVVAQDFRSGIDYPSISYTDSFGRPYTQAQIDLQVDVWVLLMTQSIEDTTLADYLAISFERIDGHLVQAPQPCSEYYQTPGVSTYAGSTRVVSLDFDNPAPIEGASVLGKADGFYLDDQALLLRQVDYSSTTATDPTIRTNLHQFALDGLHLDHIASGRVAGYIQNPVGLDLSNGIIRALTIEDALTPTPGGAPGDLTFTSTGHILTLAAADGALSELGRLSLDPGDTVYTALFAGDHAYVTTGASVDTPSQLAVIDLQDPSTPRIAGSLQIPGYATLVLPLPGERLLGIGQASSQDQTSSNLALQLIDAANPEAPILTDQYTYPEPTYSDAEYYPHSIQVDADGSRFTLPVRPSNAPLGALDVFAVSEGALAPIGRVLPQPPELTLIECLTLFGYATDPASVARFEQDEAAVASLLEQCRTYNQPQVLRGLLRGQDLYLLTNLDVASYDVAALSGPPLSRVGVPQTGYYLP